MGIGSSLRVLGKYVPASPRAWCSVIGMVVREIYQNLGSRRRKAGGYSLRGSTRLKRYYLLPRKRTCNVFQRFRCRISPIMFLWFCFQLVLGAILLCGLLYFWFFLPPTHPKNIPAVPFYVALLPLFKDVDQEDNYHKYLEKPLREHGAVKIFFAARWNIIVQRSGYLSLRCLETRRSFRKLEIRRRFLMLLFLSFSVLPLASVVWFEVS